MERCYLFVSRDGLIGDIAWRVQEEGNQVRYAITEDGFSQDVADGFVPKVDEWRDHVGWADVVVFDDSFGLGAYADELRERGVPVVGGTELTDRLEMERGFGHDVMEGLGLDVIDSRVFEEFDSGIEHVRGNPDRYIIKPCGEAQNYKDLLYVGEDRDGEDVVMMLQRYRDVWDGTVDRYQLQRRVEGVEVSICGFFTGDRFLEPVNYTFEHKRLFPGDLGPMTGEMGTSMFWGAPNQLFHETVGRFEDLLSEEGYVGPFDINCIVNGEGIYPLEPTPRFGYPQIFIQEEGLETPISELLYGLATYGAEVGSKAGPEVKTSEASSDGGGLRLEVDDGYQVGFRVCVPPFPADDVDWFEEHSRDLPVRFPGDSVPEGVHLEDIKDVGGEYRVAGETGEVLVVTGCGETMKAARAEAVSRAEEIVLPNKFYRTDVGDGWLEDVEQLIRWGYLSGS